MARTLLIFCFVAATLAGKDRAWQTGQLLDKDTNPYLHAAAAVGSTVQRAPVVQMDSGAAMAVNTHSDATVVYENFVIATEDRVYLVELSRLASFKAPHLSRVKPVTFAVEKDKLWIRDEDRAEYETHVLKQVERQGVAAASPAPTVPASTSAQPVKTDQPVAKVEPPKTKRDAAPAKDQAPVKEQTKAEPVKAEKPKPEPKPEQAKVDKPKPAKPDNLFATAALPKEDLNPPKPKPAPVAAAPAVSPAPAVPTQALVTPKAPPKTEPAPAAKPENASARATAKDRAWQSGQLLSVASNNFFLNVTYSSDLDGSAWPMVQGSDGRYSVNGQIGQNTSSAYTFDNYVIESPFVAYLVQRMRPKTSPMARFPGTHPLKFAVEKNKMWVLDEGEKEFEMKIVKLVQKDAIVDPSARAAAR